MRAVIPLKTSNVQPLLWFANPRLTGSDLQEDPITHDLEPRSLYETIEHRFFLLVEEGVLSGTLAFDCGRSYTLRKSMRWRQRTQNPYNEHSNTFSIAENVQKLELGLDMRMDKNVTAIADAVGDNKRSIQISQRSSFVFYRASLVATRRARYMIRQFCLSIRRSHRWLVSFSISSSSFHHIARSV